MSDLDSHRETYAIVAARRTRFENNLLERTPWIGEYSTYLDCLRGRMCETLSP